MVRKGSINPANEEAHFINSIDDFVQDTLIDVCDKCDKDAIFTYVSPIYFNGMRAYDEYICNECSQPKAFNKTRYFSDYLKQEDKNEKQL